jgi:3-oxoadipate enol-lactonase
MTAVLLGSHVDGPDTAPPLVLLGSLGGTADIWSPVLPALSEPFRVIRIDHQGHGASDPAPPRESVALEELAPDVLETLDALGLRKVHLAGMSFGGMVALWIAINRPERVERLTLLFTSAYLPPPESWYARAASVRASGMPSISEAVVSRWVTPGLASRDPSVAERLRTALETVDPESYAQCCTAIAAMDQRPNLSRVSAPALVLGGTEDHSTPLEHAQVLADGIPAARLEVVPGVAHIGVVERPAAIAQLMLEHFTVDTDGAAR